MNRSLRWTLALVMLAAPAGWAAGGPFGLGVILGEPTGVSGKYWIGPDRESAVDMGTAWSLSGDNEFHLHGDYLYHNYRLLHDALRVTRGKLPLYFGVGGRVKFRESKDDEVGIRIPVGASYLIANAPLEVFAELAPILDLSPDTELDINGGIGIRFYF